MPTTSTDRIEKQVEIDAPPSRVWKALTDHREFGQWFLVDLQGPFVPGKHTRGRVTYPGYEHMVMDVLVEKMEPETLFSFRWHPGTIDPDTRSDVPRTLVVFRLAPKGKGTLLTVTETGFDALPPDCRDEAFRMNNKGWDEQMQNIEKYVSSNA